MAAIIKQNHAHGNDVRLVERKQNCTLSEKRVWIAREIIKDPGNKKKKQTQKTRDVSKTTVKSKRLEVIRSATKITLQILQQSYIDGFWAAQALTKKDVVSRPLKITTLSFIHHHWHFYHPEKFLSHSLDSLDRYWLGVQKTWLKIPFHCNSLHLPQG